MYTLVKSNTYNKGLKVHGKAIGQSRLDKMEEDLKSSPKHHPKRITKMTDTENGYRYRIGDYRVMYRVYDKQVEVLLIDLDRRGGIYK